MNDPQSIIVYDAYEKVPLSVFTDELEFEFSDIDSDALPHYLIRAISRMARVGDILRRNVRIHTQDCVDNYILEPPDCMELVSVMSICSSTGSCFSDVKRFTSKPCRPICGVQAWVEPPNTIWISPGKTGQSYDINISVAPTRDTCEVDRKLYTEFYDTVIAGVKYYLFSLVDKPWSSVNRAQEYRVMFESGIRAAAMDTFMGSQRGGMKAKRLRPV